jgi:arylsulfatase A-like enzyme
LIKDSVYYPHAYTNGCWTMPSHMSILTGTLPSRHGINQSWGAIRRKKYPKMNESVKNLAEVLESHDANIKTIKYAKLPRALGFGNGFEKDNSMDPLGNKNKVNQLLKTIEKNKENDFFLFIHTWKVHAPYTSPYYLEKGRLNEEQLYYLHRPGKLGGNRTKRAGYFHRFLKKNHLYNVKDCITLYDGSIVIIDRYIGKIIDKCKQLGIYGDAMIIITADHGEHFAEHDPKLFYDHHGKDYYEEFIKVPLIIKYPKGTVDPEKPDHPVSLIDIFPTILDFYDIEIPAYVQGDSLLKSHSKRKNYFISEAVSQRQVEKKMIRVGDLKYIVTMEKPSRRSRVNWDKVIERRLYDLKNDPLEKKNLYDDPKFKGLCVNFEKMLRKIIKKSASTNLTTKETTVDQETLDQMKALGYL